MTISYTGDVANASGFGCFNKILLKWKGSVYKLIYKVSIHHYISIQYQYPSLHCGQPDTSLAGATNNRRWLVSQQHLGQGMENLNF